MKRREFITFLGGSVAAWPLAAGAQQGERMRRVGILMSGAENDRVFQSYVDGLRQGLQQLGWIEGRTLRTELRWAAGDTSRMRAHAAELVNLAPDVILVGGAATTRILQQQTHTIPIVFTNVGDPVENGLVASLARPEGNTTGFTNLYASVAGKWVELLKEAAPRVAHIALIFNPDTVPESYLTSVEAAAHALGLPAPRTPIRGALDGVRALDAFAAKPNGGLVVVPPPLVTTLRDLVMQVAEAHRLPAIYGSRDYAVEGGLMSYGGPTAGELIRRGAASYVDRLLRGAKVSELPVQFPTKFELVINLKAAKAIGLTIPEAFLLRADEIIE